MKAIDAINLHEALVIPIVVAMMLIDNSCSSPLSSIGRFTEAKSVAARARRILARLKKNA